MSTFKEEASAFLDHRPLTVAGVSREGGGPANLIYTRLRDAGHSVFPVNPAADEVEGDRCYPSVEALPEGVQGVIFAAPPTAGPDTVQACLERGIPRIWFHRSFGQGSWSEEAVRRAREGGMEVLEGGCPMMVMEPVDVAHRCMRWVLGVTGKLPGR